MEEVEGQVAVRMALSGPLNDKRVGSIGSTHSERTRRFSRLRLDVPVSATVWREPVSGRPDAPISARPGLGGGRPVRVVPIVIASRRNVLSPRRGRQRLAFGQ